MAVINTYTLKNKNNFELEVSTIGATILGLKVPNKYGDFINVVVGLNSALDYISEDYLENKLYLGATVGRYAGRISKKELIIASKKYIIHHENNIHLHGGENGFDKKTWVVESIEEGATTSQITLSYLSKHLEEGYPGNLKIFVTYTLTDKNALKITYRATTDKTTIVNLTNHSYFNLNGEGSILNHELLINSDFYLEVDENLVPSGKLNSVEKTRFDYKLKKRIKNINFKGLDDTFVLNKSKLKAEITSEKSGVKMKVYTNQPAIVVYTPKKFKNLPFKENVKYADYPAICFETQHFPDAPSNKHFPSTELNPSETYLNETTFEFSIVKE